MSDRRRVAGGLAGLFGILLCAIARVSCAHHSGAMYDNKQPMTYEGTVVEFQWSNPHVFLLVDVPTGSGPQRWTFECSSLRTLMEAGWRRTSLKPGDQVRVTANPLKDGRPGGQLLEVILPDGKSLQERWYKRKEK